MKRVIVQTLVSSGLMLFGACAMNAQDRDRDYRDQDRYHASERGEGYWRGHLFQRVREDLDHVQSMTSFFSRDEYRLARTKEELNELQDKFANGRFDDGQLDDVISALQRVVDSNHLVPRDREMLSDDLRRLREFREHHDR